MRISDWSSDVCSSDLVKEKLLAGGILDKFSEAYTEVDKQARQGKIAAVREGAVASLTDEEKAIAGDLFKSLEADVVRGNILKGTRRIDGRTTKDIRPIVAEVGVLRSEEHTSELQSLMRSSYAGLCLKKKTAKYPSHQ